MAVDQIAIGFPKTIVREGSAFTATASFRNRATAAAATPSTVHTRLDCLTTGIELEGFTSVSPASSVSIAVTGTHNAIQNAGNRTEVKQLTVVTNRGLSTQCVEAKTWTVENLLGSP
jgi:hypothetical protein